MPELKARRELFAREYLVDHNATQAATRAGYSPHSAASFGSQLLAEPEIQSRIAELAAARNERLEIDADVVLTECLRLLSADLAVAFNEDGTLKPITEIPIDCRRAIASCEVSELWGRAEGGLRTQIGVTEKIKFWNKEKAIEMLARHLSLFNDKLKVEGRDDLAQKIIAARARGVGRLMSELDYLGLKLVAPTGAVCTWQSFTHVQNRHGRAVRLDTLETSCRFCRTPFTVRIKLPSALREVTVSLRPS